MIRKILNWKRNKIILHYLQTIPELDIGGGKDTKGTISIDLDASCRPNVVADINHLPLKSKSINSIVCSHVLEHVKELHQALFEINRTLIDEGKAILFGPNDSSVLWRIIEPFYSLYYEKTVSKNSSPKTHVRKTSPKLLLSYIEDYFDYAQTGTLNFGMETYAICKKV